MCGILGYLGRDDKTIRQCFASGLEVMRMRGPDDSGTELISTDENTLLALGHRRLSILDLSMQGHQPMVSSRTHAWITYNGEVYNYKEISRELQSKGYAFKSQCDTEVILAAYDEWGKDCVRRFNGMFAFAIYDPQRRSLFLARDRIGIKPLFYSQSKGGLGCSSDLRALVAAGIAKPELAPETLPDFFAFGYFPHDLTPLRNCHKLPPGHTLEYCAETDRITIERYWAPFDSLDMEPFKDDEGEIVEQIDSLLSDAVEKQLMSDVPLGAFLSGGIDSSLLVALMSKQMKEPVKTFSIGFSVEQMNEAPYAKRIAAHLGTEHREQYVSPENLLKILPDVLQNYDEPFADTSCIPTTALARMTREHVAVALSGEGGDELYYGYTRYKKIPMYCNFMRLPSPLRSSLIALLRNLPHGRLQRWAWVLESKNVGEFYAKQCISHVPELIRNIDELAGTRAIYRVQERLGATNREAIPQVSDLLVYMPEDCLAKVDRATMAYGLEARVPILDHRFVEFSLRIPPAMRYRHGTSKHLLRKVLSKYVPSELWDRPKMGFGVPLGHWFRNELRSWITEVLNADWDWTQGAVTTEIVQSTLKSHMNGQIDHERLLWSYFALTSWARRIRVA